MDASAYLTRYGWTGGGLGYKQTGIRKPILASKKDGFHGIGVTKANKQNDQWWLNVFDAGLKDLNNNRRPVPTPILPTPDMFFPSGLYKYFVRGEGLRSTIGLSAIGLVQKKKTEPRQALRTTYAEGPCARRSVLTVDRPQGHLFNNQASKKRKRTKKRETKNKPKG